MADEVKKPEPEKQEAPAAAPGRPKYTYAPGAFEKANIEHDKDEDLADLDSWDDSKHWEE